MLLPSLIEPFVRRLDQVGRPYMVTGSTAGILYGEPRMTHDVDLVIDLRLSDIPLFVAAFPLDAFYCPPADVLAIEVRRGQRISKTNRGFGSVASERPAWGRLTGWIDAARNVSSVTTLGSRSGRGRSWALIPPAWRGGDR